jgi:hypothetical protein
VEREEFGFRRTTCACRKCSLWCEHLPGYLAPSDLDRLIPPGDDPFAWAERHLLASPGLQIRTPQFSVSIPSLVPRRQANGHCHWLEGGRCAVHENSPFGCAFLSQCGQTNAEGERITNAGRRARAEAFAQDGLYARLWRHLWDKGLRELTSDQGRSRAAQAVKRIEQAEQRRKRRKQKKAERRRKK